MSESIDIKKELVRNIAKIPEEKLLDLVAEYGTPGIADELKTKRFKEKIYNYMKDGIWECLSDEFGYFPTDIGEIKGYTEFGADPDVSCSITDEYPSFWEAARTYQEMMKENDWLGRAVKEMAGDTIKFLEEEGKI